MLLSLLNPSFAPLLALILACSPVVVSSDISWSQCDPSIVNDTALQCGFLEVPLDYHDPNVGTARLAIVKANATGERLGTVFFNPGGPGGGGLENLNALKDQLLEQTGGVYDVVSWDPRGVGLSTPGDTQCFESAEEYNAFFNGTIEMNGITYTGNFTNSTDVQNLLSQAPSFEEKYEQVGQKCLNGSNGDFLQYMGTAATVRDMVAIADVLDGPDAPINYFGISYGALLGSWFINMFPERVGRVIIDGVPDPVFFATQELSPNWAARAYVSDDDVYKALITACALSGPAGCAIASEGDSPLNIDAKVKALLQAAYDTPSVDPSFPLTSGNIRSFIFGTLYFPSRWDAFVNEWYPQAVAILQGNSSQGLSSALAKKTARSIPMDPRFNFLEREENDSRLYSGQAIFCADSADRSPSTNMTTTFEGVIEGTRTTSNLMGGVWPGLGSQCSFWPVRSVERYQGPFNKPLANRILIASTTYDHITPLDGAQRLAGLLGENASLVEMRAFGHTTLLTSPSACVTNVMVAYMVNGTLPANNTLCEVDEDYEPLRGVNTSAIFANLPDIEV
ncbi:Alpha/Beta hydrolase protein [Earliella scabrosa]|nr:Alpha/Beta hydrolase protein [Earliella scabrosa]